MGEEKALSQIERTAAGKGTVAVQSEAAAAIDRTAATIRKNNIQTMREVLAVGRFGTIKNRT